MSQRLLLPQGALARHASTVRAPRGDAADTTPREGRPFLTWQQVADNAGVTLFAPWGDPWRIENGHDTDPAAWGIATEKPPVSPPPPPDPELEAALAVLEQAKVPGSVTDRAEATAIRVVVSKLLVDRTARQAVLGARPRNG